MSRRYYANAAPQLTLAGAITNSATSLSVSGSFSGWPTQFPFFAGLDDGTASFEIVSVTAIAGTTATIVRAQDGTAAVSHPAGATLDAVVVRQDFDEANAHVNASAGVHGATGNVVGTTDVQTLTNKTLTSPVLGGTTTGSGAINTSGNITTSNAISGGSVASSTTLAATGAATAASFTANGDGKVTGVLTAKSYVNEAAATAAGANVTGSTVWLTTPTGGSPLGLYYWNGTAWTHVDTAPVGVFAAAPQTITGGNGTLTVTHGLSFTPSVVLATVGYAGSTPLHAQVFSISSTQVVLRIYRVADGTAQPDGAVAALSIHLSCFR